MAARPSAPASMAQQLGQIAATQDAQRDRLEAIERLAAEERSEAGKDRRLVMEKLDRLSNQFARLEAIPGRVEDLEKKAVAFGLFKDKVGAVVMLAGVAVSTIVGGFWWLVSTFSHEIGAFLRRMFP